MDQKNHFQKTILAWYDHNKRDLPWRHTTNPYHIFVSEFMLQQTQVARVIPKYYAFLKQFPTIESLAKASPAAVIHAWAGLGYNRRAINLQKAGQAIVQNHHSTIPKTALQLEKLPGIGKYTAGAIASFAYNLEVPVLDINIKRVLDRYFTIKLSIPKYHDDALTTLEHDLIPKGQSSTWHNALMDFGALTCTATNPRCFSCSLQQTCGFYKELQRIPESKRKTLFTITKKTVPFIGSTRYYRGKILTLLREHPIMTLQTLATKLELTDLAYLKNLTDGLIKDQLIEQHKNTLSLPKQ